MPKNFLFPKSKCSSSRFVSGLLGGFQRCGFAAPNFSRGFSPPVGAAANVRAISSVDHKRHKYPACAGFCAFVEAAAMFLFERSERQKPRGGRDANTWSKILSDG